MAAEPFRDCPACPPMVEVPAGEGVIGARYEEGLSFGAPEDLAQLEDPARRFRLEQPLAVSQMEITVGEYRRFVEATRRRTEEPCFIFDEESQGWVNRGGVTWDDPGFQQTDEDPVVCVSWFDAVDYTLWLGARTGRSYRLLTAEEWEYAARAGTETPWPFGLAPESACQSANVNNPGSRVQADIFPCEDGFEYTAPAVWFEPNGFGLQHMIGNVWEWTATCFEVDDAGTCRQRVNKGGSWADPVWRTRPAVVEWDPPEGRYAIHGFRIARDMGPETGGDDR